MLGVARFPAKYKDRRGQTIKPGVYTMRYGLFPVNGDHQGVAPQRDFLIPSPAALDDDLKADAKPGIEAQGDDVIVTTKMGATAISVIVAGQHVG